MFWFSIFLIPLIGVLRCSSPRKDAAVWVLYFSDCIAFIYLRKMKDFPVRIIYMPPPPRPNLVPWEEASILALSVPLVGGG